MSEASNYMNPRTAVIMKQETMSDGRHMGGGCRGNRFLSHCDDMWWYCEYWAIAASAGTYIKKKKHVRSGSCSRIKAGPSLMFDGAWCIFGTWHTTVNIAPLQCLFVSVLGRVQVQHAKSYYIIALSDATSKGRRGCWNHHNVSVLERCSSKVPKSVLHCIALLCIAAFWCLSFLVFSEMRFGLKQHCFKYIMQAMQAFTEPWLVKRTVNREPLTAGMGC